MEEVKDVTLEATALEDDALTPKSGHRWRDGAWRRSTPLRSKIPHSRLAWRMLGARGACSSAGGAGGAQGTKRIEEAATGRQRCWPAGGVEEPRWRTPEYSMGWRFGKRVRLRPRWCGGLLAGHDGHQAATGPSSKCRDGLYHPSCLSSGPGTDPYIKPGWPKPMKHRIMSCSCQAKIASFGLGQ